ncbi:hypothetical protein RclHR1_02640026 [Rhizophagus clarus]|uniref:Uncharacterized protein n=1 Tax=Rhizophagus clarus TaxID=94130 RepID=A0A2Z6R506_9GLOM|nr:hypothetical protein RclHR1_02640026 [Rhizophagus clarus]
MFVFFLFLDLDVPFRRLNSIRRSRRSPDSIQRSAVGFLEEISKVWGFLERYETSKVYSFWTKILKVYSFWTKILKIKAYIELLITHLTTHENSDERKDRKRLREINLIDSEWDLLKDLLHVFSPFEKINNFATRYLGSSYYSTHSLMRHVVETLKGFFKPASINNKSYNYNNVEERDAFNNQDKRKINKILASNGRYYGSPE